MSSARSAEKFAQGKGRVACTGSVNGPTLPSILKKVGPYLFAAVALYWVYKHTDKEKLTAAIKAAPLGSFE